MYVTHINKMISNITHGYILNHKLTIISNSCIYIEK